MLAALLDGELHGYVIIKRVEALWTARCGSPPARCMQCWTGSPTRGWSRWSTRRSSTGGPWRYYALTADGGTALQDEAARLAAAAKMVTNATARRRAINTAVSPA